MKFESVSDIKNFINIICNSTECNNKYYDDLIWYSKANYTMSTEYYGDIKIFVEKIIAEPTFAQYKDDLKQLLTQLNKLF